MVASIASIAGVLTQIAACTDPYADDATTPVPERTGPGDTATAETENANEGADANVPCEIRAPACDLGTCKKIVIRAGGPGPGTEFPFAITTDATRVFFVTQSPPGDAYNGSGMARIVRAKKDGAAPAETIASAQNRATILTLADGFVYWAAHSDPDAAIAPSVWWTVK